MSKMKNLIDEYSNDARFWEGQASQWRTLAIAFLLDLRSDEDISIVIPYYIPYYISESVIENVTNYDISAEQGADNEIVVTLVKVSDA